MPTRFAVVLTFGLGALLFVFDNWIIVTIVILGIVLLWTVKAFSHIPPPESPRDRDPLRFDEVGLHWCDLKGPIKWSWSELSRFEVDQDGETGQVIIRYNVPDDDRFDRISRWVFTKPSKRIYGQIPDIYEASLQEIADNLNEYRDRALAK